MRERMKKKLLYYLGFECVGRRKRKDKEVQTDIETERVMVGRY